MQLPVLLRFSDILRFAHQSLSEGFENAIAEYGYDGGYTTVYPIKVNQQRHVVEEIVQFGTAIRRWTGVRIQAQLQAVLGLSESTEHIIVCNGYKDEEFMRLALMDRARPSRVHRDRAARAQIDVLLSVADELGCVAVGGIRIKLASTGNRALEGERWREVEVRG